MAHLPFPSPIPSSPRTSHLPRCHRQVVASAFATFKEAHEAGSEQVALFYGADEAKAQAKSMAENATLAAKAAEEALKEAKRKVEEADKKAASAALFQMPDQMDATFKQKAEASAAKAREDVAKAEADAVKAAQVAKIAVLTARQVRSRPPVWRPPVWRPPVWRPPTAAHSGAPPAHRSLAAQAASAHVCLCICSRTCACVLCVCVCVDRCACLPSLNRCANCPLASQAAIDAGDPEPPSSPVGALNRSQSSVSSSPGTWESMREPAGSAPATTLNGSPCGSVEDAERKARVASNHAEEMDDKAVAAAIEANQKEGLHRQHLDDPGGGLAQMGLGGDS